MRAAALIAVLCLVAVALFSAVTRVPGETALHMLFGWIVFAARSASDLTINWNGVTTVVLCASLLLVGAHRFLRWLVTASAAGGSSEHGTHGLSAVSSWPLRRTARLLSLVVLMFVAGIAFIGVVHQAAWLATSPEPLTQYRLVLQFDDYNLQSIGMAETSYVQVYAKPPISGYSAAHHPGAGSHSWQTWIAPYLAVDTQNIHFDLDWDHPENAPAFRRFVTHYLNSEIGVLREKRGFAVSHYAGNVNVLAPDRPVDKDSASTLGSSNTFFAGEVAASFKPWGDPSNLRDLAIGIDQPNGFCGPDGRGANFVMLDGSVRFLSKKTDMAVFETLTGKQAHGSTGDEIEQTE